MKPDGKLILIQIYKYLKLLKRRKTLQGIKIEGFI